MTIDTKARRTADVDPCIEALLRRNGCRPRLPPQRLDDECDRIESRGERKRLRRLEREWWDSWYRIEKGQ